MVPGPLGRCTMVARLLPDARTLHRLKSDGMPRTTTFCDRITICCTALTNGTLEADIDELLRLGHEFHRQMLKHIPDKAVDDQRHRLLAR
jgi:hypothetical protein